MIFGTVRSLDSQEEKIRALEAIIAKYEPLRVEAGLSEGQAKRTRAYELSVDGMTYKHGC